LGDRRQSAAALCRAHAEIGGFPEVVLKPIDGGGYLRTLLAAVIHKDIVSRFRLRAPQALRVSPSEARAGLSFSTGVDELPRGENG
jgi:predicted AAA+ superfamily ATPase